MNKKALRLLLTLLAFLPLKNHCFGVCDENTPPHQMINEMFANLYEFNYSCQPSAPHIPYTPDLFLRDLRLCGEPLILQQSFLNQVEQCAELMHRSLPSSSAQWVDGITVGPLLAGGFDAIFGQAIILPPNVKIPVIGDLHGNSHSLARNIKRLQHLNLADEQCKFNEDVVALITGDLGDRGHYSVETWALALAIKKQNPQNFLILQGNHENHGSSENPSVFSQFGFECELFAKFFRGHPEFEMQKCHRALFNLFNHLPQVFFIGSRADNGEVVFVQICHAGTGVYGKPRTPNSIDVTKLLHHTLHAPPGTLCGQVFIGHEQDNGFTWNGFTANPSAPALNISRRGRGLIFNGNAVTAYLQKISEPGAFRVCGIIRGHDHLPGGINKLNFTPEDEADWVPLEDPEPLIPGDLSNGYPVYTITSAPEGCGADAFGVLTFDHEHGLWFIKPYVFETPHNGADQGKWRWKVQPIPETPLEFRTIDDQPVRTE